ncbi:hypothetical protein PR202_gb22322 [Eleusine coracana subsp. coracana]|uniref:Prolyl endopeptidase n=1 Tax=Eleusine coracana subsp. coracana TaxID=191504 RepID=A0AAV5FFE0_ELECO|nr:hypothetical protein PR202_gb22322 [Eleusine coracana subsp. coracana]
MLRRRPRLRAFLRHLATSTCRRSSCHPLQPHVPDSKSLPLPPVAKKVPFTVSAHGRSWSDPYHWMRDTSDPDLAALLAAENAYADAFVGSAAAGLRSRLAAEMRARLPPSAVTPPEPWGPWLYYQYVPEGMEYPVLSRKRRPSGGLAALLDYFSGSDKEQVLLDWNEFAEKNGKVFCKRLQSDEAGFLLFTEQDVNSCVDITSTKDFKYITVNSNTRTASEEDLSYLVLIWLQVYVIESDNVRKGLWPIRKRADQVQYFLEHHNGFFYILTNVPLKDAETPTEPTEGYYLARSRAEKSLVNEWQIVMLPGSDCVIEDMDMFHDSLVLFLRKNGSHLFCSIDMPIDVDFEIPDLTVDYDMRKKTFSILHQEEVNSISASLGSAGLESNISSIQQNLQVVEKSQSWSDLSKQFSWKRLEVISHDGVPIPLLILYSPEAHQHGESPGIIYGYGAYGEDLDKSWCSERLSLLARGWVLAFADVRGGAGVSWHLAGTKANKINSIQDFAACSMHLIKEGYVHNRRLCAVGCSAGGLLVGAVINMHPDLFAAAVLKVPFLDICNTMLDPTLPLTILDYEEFGDPNIQVEFEAIYSYSPYDNLSPEVCYPPVLVTASFNDTRFVPCHIDTYANAENILVSALEEYEGILCTSVGLNNVWGQILPDPFLRRLILSIDKMLQQQPG